MKYRCTKCLFQFDEPWKVDYGVQLWEDVECCPHCDSERIEKNTTTEKEEGYSDVRQYAREALDHEKK